MWTLQRGEDSVPRKGVLGGEKPGEEDAMDTLLY